MNYRIARVRKPCFDLDQCCGEPTGTPWSGVDLTDLLYRVIADTAADGIVVIDRSGAIRSVNSD